MDRTPTRKSKLSTRKDDKNEDNFAMSGSSSTPMQEKAAALYDECSPIFVPCTQEAYDQLDVVWDWNSPQSKPNQKKKPERNRSRVRSPKPIVKKYSHNQPSLNEKVKSQLESLKNQLESKLRPSNVKESKAKTLEEDLEDLFNDDSIEEELIFQSQKVENLIRLETKSMEFRKVKSHDCLDETASKGLLKRRSTSSGNLYESPKPKAAASIKLENKFECSFNDSFDLALQSFKDADLKPGETNLNQTKSKSDSSMSMSFVEEISTFDMAEIERKRQEALAKLRAKKLHNVISPLKRGLEDINRTKIVNPIKIPKAEESPIKCSPEEIEQKRLQALAKLEAKKKQDIIERNRREALKRLEMNKRKRAMLLQTMKS